MSEQMNTSGEQGAIAPKWFMKAMTKINVFIYRLSRGRWMNTLEGVPICLVTMTGIKSGKQRTIALMYVPQGNNVLLVASQGGAPKNPIWYKNMQANPMITIEQGGRSMKMKVRELAGEEKLAAWPVCDAVYAPYEQYRTRTQREIPILICEPA